MSYSYRNESRPQVRVDRIHGAKRTMASAFARGLEGFAPLAERSGYAIAESRTAVVSEQVLLRPRATAPPSQ